MPMLAHKFKGQCRARKLRLVIEAGQAMPAEPRQLSRA
jgi:hypothetical protein